MQFSTITLPILALLFTNTLAMPSSAIPAELLTRGDNCKVSCTCAEIHPACQGSKVVGQTSCRCDGQSGTCDVVTCPGSGANTVMVCGQSGTGCVWI